MPPHAATTTASHRSWHGCRSQLYTKSSDGGWREASPLEAAGASVAEFLAALDAKVDGVVDLDDHMEDVSKDWTCSPVGAGAKAQAD